MAFADGLRDLGHSVAAACGSGGGSHRDGAKQRRSGGGGDAPFTNRAQILDAARAFRERGGRLVRLTFPETQAQRFGDVVVLYGRFEVVFQSGGAERTRRGRLTEMFVRRDGKWLHPGWHLDLTAGPAQP